MADAIEQGKLDIAELIRIEVEKKDIHLVDIRWQSNDPTTRWEVEVGASNGRTAYQKFSPKQLAGFQNDNRLKMQVHAKVASIIIHLDK